MSRGAFLNTVKRVLNKSSFCWSWKSLLTLSFSNKAAHLGFYYCLKTERDSWTNQEKYGNFQGLEGVRDPYRRSSWPDDDCSKKQCTSLGNGAETKHLAKGERTGRQCRLQGLESTCLSGQAQSRQLTRVFTRGSRWGQWSRQLISCPHRAPSPRKTRGK